MKKYKNLNDEEFDFEETDVDATFRMFKILEADPIEDNKVQERFLQCLRSGKICNAGDEAMVMGLTLTAMSKVIKDCRKKEVKLTTAAQIADALISKAHPPASK